MTEVNFGGKDIFRSQIEGHVLTPFFDTCQGPASREGKGPILQPLPIWRKVPSRRSQRGHQVEEEDLADLHGGTSS